MKGEENSNYLISSILSPRMCLRPVRECSLQVIFFFFQLISLWKTGSPPADVPYLRISRVPRLCLSCFFRDGPGCSLVFCSFISEHGSKILMELPPRSRNRIVPHPTCPLLLLLNHNLFLPVEKVLIHYMQGKRCKPTLGFIIQEGSGNSCQG